MMSGVTAESNRPLRWGILSTSSFAQKVFIPGLRRSTSVEVAAVASRSMANAQAYAQTNNIPTACGSYEDLLADPSIDVVYIPMPNTLHVEWTAKAAAAGKHVLCEKPMGMTATELDTLLPYTSKVHIAEAFMVRFHPQWIETRELVRSGSIGRITHMHVEFNYTNTDPSNIRNTLNVGGGAMYDIGCYAVVAARWFMEADPVRVAAVTDLDPTFGTDRLTSGLLDFGDGRTCTFSVSTQTVPHQRVHLLGTTGRLEITVPFNQPQTDSTTYLTHDGQSLDGLDAQSHTLSANDQYALQADAFCERIRNEPPTDRHLRDAMINMAVIDATFRSAQSGRFEPIV
jgi:predicted dehydrogenase